MVQNKNEFEHRGSRTVLGKTKQLNSAQQTFKLKENLYYVNTNYAFLTPMERSVEHLNLIRGKNTRYVRNRFAAGVPSGSKVQENMHDMQNWVKKNDTEANGYNDVRLPSFKAAQVSGKKCQLNSNVNFRNMQSSVDAWHID